MAEYTGWTITTGFHGSDLFAEHQDDIDEHESIRRYADMLQAALEARYPGAEVDVRYDTGVTGCLPFDLKTHVYPAGDVPPDEDEEQVVDDVAGRIFEQGEWYVEIKEEELA